MAKNEDRRAISLFKGDRNHIRCSKRLPVTFLDTVIIVLLNYAAHTRMSN